MHKTKRVMVVGAGWDQTPIIVEARRQGHHVIALDGNPEAHGLKYAHRSYAVHTRDREGVLEVARSEGVDAITYMITESPLYAVHAACTALGLPGPSYSSVEATVNKARMREIFRDAGIPQPPFTRAGTLSDARRFASVAGWPLVMKPADVGGQLGLARLTSFEELEARFAEAQSEAVGGEVILEGLLDGPEVNAVAIVIGGRVAKMIISDRIKHAARAFGVVRRHLYPCACAPADVRAILDVCERAASAMEVKDGILFPQLIVTEAGPRVVEIGERIPGGVMKELFELATGIDLVKLQLAIAFGEDIRLDDYRFGPAHPAVTVKFLTADPGSLIPGVVHARRGVEAALRMEGIAAAEYYNDPTKPQVIRSLRNGRDRFFFVIATGRTREEAVQRSEMASAVIDFVDEDGTSLRRPA